MPISAINIGCLAVFGIKFIVVKIIMGMLSALMIITFIFISVFIWRCPNCRQELPIIIKSKDFDNEYECPYCGEKIKEHKPLITKKGNI